MFPDTSKHYEDLKRASDRAALYLFVRCGDDETRRLTRESEKAFKNAGILREVAGYAVTAESAQYELCGQILHDAVLIRSARLAEESLRASLVARRDEISETIQREALTTAEASALIEELAKITNYLDQDKTDEEYDDHADVVFANRRGEGL